jgi:hypothetical protein
VLPHALTLHSGIHIFAGEFATAEALSDEAHEVSAAIGVPVFGKLDISSRIELAGALPAAPNAALPVSRRPGQHERARAAVTRRTVLLSIAKPIAAGRRQERAARGRWVGAGVRDHARR